MIYLLFWIALLVVILAVFGSAAWAGMRAAPWLPTRTRDTHRMLKLAALKPGERFFELGCGDGRVCLIAAETYGAIVTGYEISFLPFCIALIRRLRSPARARITIRYKDFFRVPLAHADVVFCFLTPMAMKRLNQKIVHECKPGARIISSTFSLHGLKGVERNKPSKKEVSAYLYRVPDR